MNNEYPIGYSIKEEDGGVIKLAFLRATDQVMDSTEIAHGINREIEQLLDKYGEHEALLLVELVEDDGIVSEEAKRIYKKLIHDKRVMRLAIYGGLTKYRRIAKLLLPLTGGEETKVFDSKAEALQWLIRS